tara:strand:- start:224 stop:1090 length:867 start_codon:yes stop_codon:yes gene_type:complete
MNLAQLMSDMNNHPNTKEMKQQFRAKTLQCDNNEEVDFMCNMFKSLQNNDNSVEFNVHPLASFQFGMNVNNEELEKLQIPNMNDLIMSASKILGGEFTNEINNMHNKKKERNNNNEPRVEEILEDTIKPIEDTIKPVKIHFDITFQQLYNGFYLYDLDEIENVQNIDTVFVDVPNQFVPPGVVEIYDSGIYHIIFNILPHDHFELKDDILYYNYSISLKESLCGFSFNLEHLNGNPYLIKNYNKIIKPGHEIVIPKLGLNSGKLIIKFHIIFPEELDEKIIDQLKIIF